MGASNSIRMLYKNSLLWFRQYIDAETYMDNFKAMDRHSENALSFADIQHWIVSKCKTDPTWCIFLTSGPVLTLAHKYACKHGDTHSSVSASKMVDITEFKTFFVHLFAITILWCHFQNAVAWEESGEGSVDHRLKFEAFKLAWRTFDSANMHEELIDSLIRSDFDIIDVNFGGSVGFIEICNYCCKFIDDPDVEKRVTLVPKFFGDTTHLPSDELLVALSEGPKSYYIAASIDQKNHEMVAALITKLDAQKDNLKSAAALEHQNNVRKKYCEIHSLLKHPLCYGFLLHFCRNQRSDENLSFIRAVEEYREIFSSDWIGSQSLWSNDWREIDSSVEINSENLSEQSLNCDLWVSNLPKDVIHSKIESILSKYLRDDAQHQVCISKCLIARTLKRAKLLHLYGPSIFDEACMDPILTMERDVLPRFRKSDIVNTMVMRVASCEPVPPAKDLNVPPPENLLLHLCPAEAFPDTRCFTLDELIGSQHLYDSFLTFLQNISKEKALKLLCTRKIDIFEELMRMNCVKEATEEAWQIYRYYVAQGAAFEIPISSVELVELMVSLAVPKRDMFVSVRQSAYVNLTSYFSAFVKTAAYRGLSKLMRDLKSEAPASQHGVSVSMAMASSELPLIHCRSSREDRVRVNNHKDRQENEKEIDQAVTPKISKVTMAGTLISSLSIRKLRL